MGYFYTLFYTGRGLFAPPPNATFQAKRVEQKHLVGVVGLTLNLFF